MDSCRIYMYQRFTSKSLYFCTSEVFRSIPLPCSVDRHCAYQFPGFAMLNLDYLHSIVLLLFGALTIASNGVFGEFNEQDGCEFGQQTTGDMLGPYYKPNSPIQHIVGNEVPSICVNTPGNFRLYLNGTVRLNRLADICGFPTKALVDVWHADGQGAYSNISAASQDYKCRARLYTKDDGSYAFSTVFPGRYIQSNGYRPAHIHMRITAVDRQNKPIAQTFTTQVYFLGDQYLAPTDSCDTCGSGNPAQIIPIYQNGDTATYSGTFDPFVLAPEQTPNPDFYGPSHGSSVPLNRVPPLRNQNSGQNNFQSFGGNDFMFPGEPSNANGQRGDWSFPQGANESPNNYGQNNGGQGQPRGGANQQGNSGQYNSNMNNRNDRSNYGR